MRDPKGNGEGHKADRIVQRDNGQQQIRQRAAGLILTHDHQCGGRRGCGGNGAKRDGLRHGKFVRDENVQKKQRRIDAQHGGKSLKDSDNDRLTPDVRDIFQPKLITDRKRDKAKSNLGNQGHEIDCFHADEAKPGDSQGA